ncbi:MAG: hypothetical protein ACOYM8_00195 [Caulobacterales bacterium]|jgi:hypothetical protein
MSALRAALVAFIGSRLAIGVAALVFVAFAAHSATAPDRLPPFGRVGLAQLGVFAGAPSLDQVQLPDIIPADIQADLRVRAVTAVGEAAPVATRRVSDYLRDHPKVVRWINYAGTLIAFAVLMLAMRLQANTIRTRRSDVYAFVDGGYGT